MDSQTTEGLEKPVKFWGQMKIMRLISKNVHLTHIFTPNKAKSRDEIHNH